MQFVGLQRRLGEWRQRPRTADTAIDSCARTLARELMREAPGVNHHRLESALRCELRIATQDIRLEALEGRLS